MSEHIEPTSEWGSLSASWKGADTEPPIDVSALRAHVDAESRRMRWWLALEIGLTIAALCWAALNLARHPGMRASVLAADTITISAIVWAFGLYGRRGLWDASAATTHAYLRTARRRASLRLRTAWLAVGLVGAQWTLITLAPVEITPLGVGSSVVATIAWLGWAVWAGRRARRELRRLDAVLAPMERDGE